MVYRIIWILVLSLVVPSYSRTKGLNFEFGFLLAKELVSQKKRSLRSRSVEKVHKMNRKCVGLC